EMLLRLGDEIRALAALPFSAPSRHDSSTTNSSSDRLPLVGQSVQTHQFDDETLDALSSWLTHNSSSAHGGSGLGLTDLEHGAGGGGGGGVGSSAGDSFGTSGGGPGGAVGFAAPSSAGNDLVQSANSALAAPQAEARMPGGSAFALVT